MEQNTFITGTDVQLISELSSIFQNAGIPHTHIEISNAKEQSKHSIQLSNVSVPLIDLNLQGQSNSNTNTIIICLNCPLISNILDLDEYTVSLHFNTELFFTFELLRKSIQFLQQQVAHKHIAPFTLVVVYPQSRSSTDSAQRLFISMVESCYQNMICHTKNIGIRSIIVKFHHKISYDTKIELLKKLMQQNTQLPLLATQAREKAKKSLWKKTLRWIADVAGKISRSKKPVLYKYYKPVFFRKLFQKASL